MKSISDIATLAGQYVKATLPPLTQQSPPIPIGDEQDLRAAFLYFRGEVVDPERRYLVWPPSYVASFRMQDGKFEELLAVTPGSFQLDSDPDIPLGAGFAPLDKMEPGYLSELARYYQSLDALLPSFAKRAEITDMLSPAAADATQALTKILEAPLHGFVKRLGSSFFAWLELGR